MTLANYQESKVRWLHDLLGRWVDVGRADVLGLRHPFTRALYEQDGNGQRPRAHQRRTVGVFTADGILDRGRGVRGRPAAVQLGRRAEGRPPPHPAELTAMRQARESRASRPRLVALQPAAVRRLRRTRGGGRGGGHGRHRPVRPFEYERLRDEERRVAGRHPRPCSTRHDVVIADVEVVRGMVGDRR